MRPGLPSSAPTAWSAVRSCRPPRSGELRDLTRARTAITRERGREVQRLEKLPEDAGIKLSSVASDITDITGVSARAMLEALITGDQDPAALADLADLADTPHTRRLRHRGHHLYRIGAVRGDLAEAARAGAPPARSQQEVLQAGRHCVTHTAH